MWELDCEESWAPKNCCFWTVVLEKTLECPLDCKEIQQVHSKGDQSWVFIGRTDAEGETPILWPPHVKSWLMGKDPDAGRDWGQEEKGMTEDKMAGWHHWLDAHEFGWTPGAGDVQEGLACCNSWGCKESDTTEWLNWTETVVEVMKTMVISFKRSHASTATLSAPSPAAVQHQSTPLPETPGHSQASLGQSFVGSLLLFPGSWCIRFCLCLQWLYFPALCKFWQFYGGVNGDLLQDGLCHTTSAAPRTPAPVAVHCWPVPPQEMLRHSSISVSVGSQRFKTL